MGLIQKIFGTYSQRELKSIYPIADKIEALEEEYRALTDEQLQAKTPEFKQRLQQGETLDDILPEAFAAVREAADRVLGLRPYRVQLIGGIVLHQGRIAEMKTGEGKTLVATLPAYLNALTGNGVHIVTVNDYLAKRDSEWMGKVHRFMGLTVGLIVHDLTKEQRQAAYAADITYGTNNEMGFDYLRDNMAIYKNEQVQRGHSFAIVDEVDSILIDEARTPLIISGMGEKSTQLYDMAESFACRLKKYVVTETDDKEAEDETLDADYIVDEKARTATLTARGIAKAEEFFHLDNLSDPENSTIAHHINQAIKAHGTMKRDIDYVVKDGEVIIVDEFTGRLMFGRRYSEGLHQAIEAKEHVSVQRESKTLATITFQNYFRLYGKLSGMTGTAMTEEEEFATIYKLDIVEIPTNRPVVRIDNEDAVYKTEQGKYRAVIRQVKECHEKGQPVLVGTVSIEKNELLSRMLTKEGIRHNLLNAKNHEKEAEIVAQAGKFGAVTVATNMAGRGTDIMLGGNVTYMAKATLRKELTRQMNADLEVLKDEYEHAKARAKAQGLPIPPAPDTAYEAKVEMLMTECDGHADTQDADILAARKRFDELVAEYEPEVKREAEAVREAGGLFIIGTERHESRRIDNQLRGRAGRQGDPGTSKFFLSLEDDLMRIFGSERMSVMLQRLGLPEGEALIHPWISKALEKAQQKVEERNFDIRKNLLKYDNVMNDQRKVIYEQRKELMEAEDVSETLQDMREEYLSDVICSFLPSHLTPSEWPVDELQQEILRITGFNFPIADWAKEPEMDAETMGRKIIETLENELKAKNAHIPENIMHLLQKNILLQVLDQLWKDHIATLDLMRHTIVLRAYGQKDPLIEYKKEAFNLFSNMLDQLREKTTFLMCRATIQTESAEAFQPQAQPARMQEIHEQPETLVGKQIPEADEAEKAEPFRYAQGAVDPKDPRTWGKVARNDLCPCGSGKKYKHCHGQIA